MKILFFFLALLSSQFVYGDLVANLSGPGGGVDRKLVKLKKGDKEIDQYMQAYGACWGINPKLLKAIAYAESGLDPYQNCKTNPMPPVSSGKTKYLGLFQMDQVYCDQNIKKYSGFLNCKHRCDVETNIAAGSYRISQNFKKIEKACPKATIEEKILLVYLGHNNGPVVLKNVLKQKACAKAEHEAAIRKVYNDRGGKIGRVDTEYGVKKWKYGQKIVKAANKYKVEKVFVGKRDKDICPIDTKGMDFAAVARKNGKEITAISDRNISDVSRDKSTGILKISPPVIQEGGRGTNAKDKN